MKYVGSYFAYEQARNSDLMRAYETVFNANRGAKKEEIYKRVVEMPSSRFWVSEERAATIVLNIIKGDKLESMKPKKRLMYFEIYRRVMEAKKKDPDAPISYLTFDVVSSPAPQFYLTPQSAKTIISKIKRKWYEARKQSRA